MTTDVKVMYTDEVQLVYSIDNDDLPIFIRCLTMPGNAGYKRIILFGRDRISEE